MTTRTVTNRTVDIHPIPTRSTRAAAPALAAALLVALALLLAAPAPAAADWLDEDAIEEQFEDEVLYLRIDAPCATGRHPYGVYKRPLVEVSPEGVNTDADDVFTASWWHADSTYWAIRVNDPVEVDEWDFDEDDREVEIELEGVGPAEDEDTVILLVDIDDEADFWAALEKAFARQPLQDLHDDWSPEVKEAIADRRLVDGMSKRQAYYVTGRPERFETKTENGTEVEIWHLRQDKGMKTSYFFAKAGEATGLPTTIRFENGELVDASNAGTGDDFSLDD